MSDDLLTYWRAHPDDSRAALALIETQVKVIEEARALLEEALPMLGIAPDVIDWDWMGAFGGRIEAFLAASDPT